MRGEKRTRRNGFVSRRSIYSTVVCRDTVERPIIGRGRSRQIFLAYRSASPEGYFQRFRVETKESKENRQKESFFSQVQHARFSARMASGYVATCTHLDTNTTVHLHLHHHTMRHRNTDHLTGSVGLSATRTDWSRPGSSPPHKWLYCKYWEQQANYRIFTVIQWKKRNP